MVPNKFDGYDILLQGKVSPGRYIVLGTRSSVDHATFIYDEQTEQFTNGCYFGSVKRACHNYTLRKEGEIRAYQNKLQKAKK